MTPSSTYKSVRVLGWLGKWDLYYFRSLAEAVAFKDKGPLKDSAAILTEVCAGQLWRLAYKVEEKA